MIYTGKGDGGYTEIFGDGRRIPKSASVINALGSLDEVNSLLGLARAKLADDPILKAITKMIEETQQVLFIAQASLGGANQRITKSHVAKLEEQIKETERELPIIKNFVIPGANEVSAILDYARATARRAEREVVADCGGGSLTEKEYLLAYLNRLSSLLYALARLVSHERGITEAGPSY